MESLQRVLDDIVNMTSPQGWGFMALGAACVTMMWYFNSAGHHLRIAAAIAKRTEQDRILGLGQQAIAEAFESKHQKGEINKEDKDAMYAMMFKNNPKMKELKPDSKDIPNKMLIGLIGVGAKVRTKWPFRSKADEARTDLANLVSSINASKK